MRNRFPFLLYAGLRRTLRGIRVQRDDLSLVHYSIVFRDLYCSIEI